MRTLSVGLAVLVLAAVSKPAWAVYDVIIDDSNPYTGSGDPDGGVQFLDWTTGTSDGQLQTSATGGYNNLGFHWVTNWGGAGNPSARVRYYLPPLPTTGSNQYHVFSYSPGAHSTRDFHIVNATDNDTTEAYPYFMAGIGGFHNDDAFIQMGDTFPDPAGDGNSFILNNTGHPAYIYIKYQPFYDNDIAFDAIRVVQVPEPASLAGLSLGGFGLVALRRRSRIA